MSRFTAIRSKCHTVRAISCGKIVKYRIMRRYCKIPVINDVGLKQILINFFPFQTTPTTTAPAATTTPSTTTANVSANLAPNPNPAANTSGGTQDRPAGNRNTAKVIKK